MASEQDITALKRRRVVIQGACTRTKTFVESLETIIPSIAAQLEERRTKLNDNWSEYQNVQLQIEIFDKGESNHRAGFENAFYILAARIRELLAPQVLPRNQTTPSPSLSNTSEIPRATTHSIIHANASINEVQKLQYLNGCLRDDASKVINSLEISALNYEVAWNLLKERYDNKRIIVHNHIKAIMDLPCMTKENLTELRQIADGATRHD
ncbi:PREDICTED: uncharacterized protein LOC105556856 [Vollenhovia emeryi]|uniref:uncharacterized protein LOC105556856 n=1 Tax=Vollenhovia emeryi TaxID=411798 RepID=UPI0005F4B07C|nr:PREDICTED: uncharacterized protein LOC105556856 [Vollenhovia emeryi]